MTIDPEGFTKAEIEKLRNEGWRFGPGLDWREFMPDRNANVGDQPQAASQPAQTPEPEGGEG